MTEPTKTHEVWVVDAQADCCDDRSHRTFYAACSCGWQSRGASRRSDAHKAILYHRIHVLEQFTGITFDVHMFTEPIPDPAWVQRLRDTPPKILQEGEGGLDAATLDLLQGGVQDACS